tara:strand:- start:1032 stop:1610 length:579 start_codon:yes stop_codon:yes gene_type:complete
MFCQQTRLNRAKHVNKEGVIYQDSTLKYVTFPIIEDSEQVFLASSTLPRSISTISDVIDTNTTLRDSKITHCKDPQYLPTDRLSLTTPQIRYGDPANYGELIPKESQILCNNSELCNNTCDRGLPYEGDRYIYRDPQTEINNVQYGFSDSLITTWGSSNTNGFGIKPEDSRLFIHDLYANKEISELMGTHRS